MTVSEKIAFFTSLENCQLWTTLNASLIVYVILYRNVNFRYNMEEDEDGNKVFIFAGFPADKAKEKEELIAK